MSLLHTTLCMPPEACPCMCHSMPHTSQSVCVLLWHRQGRVICTWWCARKIIAATATVGEGWGGAPVFTIKIPLLSWLYIVPQAALTTQAMGKGLVLESKTSSSSKSSSSSSTSPGLVSTSSHVQQAGRVTQSHAWYCWCYLQHLLYSQTLPPLLTLCRLFSHVATSAWSGCLVLLASSSHPKGSNFTHNLSHTFKHSAKHLFN